MPIAITDEQLLTRCLSIAGRTTQILLGDAVLTAAVREPSDPMSAAPATKVLSSERLQRLGQLLADLVGRHGDPAEQETAELCRWLDIPAKRNIVLTFGGGVNEIQRELIAISGLGLPRVPR